MPKMITLAIVLDHRMAQCLGSCASCNFLHDQPDRFEVMTIDGHDDVTCDVVEPLIATPLKGGTFTWCGTLGDALLLRAFEQSCGFQTALLWDLAAAEARLPAGGYADGDVVLSTRQFPHG